jgi:hypothetical protein
MGEEGRNQKKERDKEWVRKEGIKSTKTRMKQKRAMKRERTRERACVFYKPSFLPSILPFSSLPFVALLSGKTFCKHKRGKKTKQNNHNNNNDSRTRPPVSLANWWEKKKTEKQQRQQTNALHQKTCRAPDSDTTDKEKGRKSGRSERPVLRPNAIMTRRFGGPLRAWVAGSIITRNTDSIITRSWDSIITLKGFRKIILA